MIIKVMGYKCGIFSLSKHSPSHTYQWEQSRADSWRGRPCWSRTWISWGWWQTWRGRPWGRWRWWSTARTPGGTRESPGFGRSTWRPRTRRTELKGEVSKREEVNSKNGSAFRDSPDFEDISATPSWIGRQRSKTCAVQLRSEITYKWSNDRRRNKCLEM